jgi:hypothetical protein
MKLVIIDIISNNYQAIKDIENIFDDNEVLALTPSSFYYLENNNILFKSFHDLISQEQFKNITLSIYEDTLNMNRKNNYFKSYFIDIAKIICLDRKSVV